MLFWAACCRSSVDEGRAEVEQRVVLSVSEHEKSPFYLDSNSSTTDPTSQPLTQEALFGEAPGKSYGPAGGISDSFGKTDEQLAALRAQDGLTEEERFQRSKDQSSALHEVASKGTPEDLEYLFRDPRVKVHINALNVDGETPLHRAVYWSNAALVEPLIAASADVHQADRKGKTPLRKAYQDAEITRLLLKAGADANATDKHGDTTMHKVVEDGNAAVAAALIEHGASVNAESAEGWPPLHQAAESGHLEVLEVLLRAGAKLQQPNSENQTALQCAVAAGKPEAADFLRSRGG